MSRMTGEMAETLLAVDGIDVSYRDVQVLRDVSLYVCKGEIVTVIGPNGAGKSTLLNTIVGFRHPHKGSIVFEDQPIHHLTPEKVVRLGLTTVPEGARVFAEMSVLDNLKMGSYLKEARGRRDETLRGFPILPEARRADAPEGRNPQRRERQMLAISRALMSRPKLLLLDEPSLGLAPLLVIKVFEAIRGSRPRESRSCSSSRTFIILWKSPTEVYVLENGRYRAQRTGREMSDNDHVRKSYLAL